MGVILDETWSVLGPADPARLVEAAERVASGAEISCDHPLENGHLSLILALPLGQLVELWVYPVTPLVSQVKLSAEVPSNRANWLRARMIAERLAETLGPANDEPRDPRASSPRQFAPKVE